MESRFTDNQTYIDHSTGNNHRGIVRRIFSGILIGNPGRCEIFHRDIVKFHRVLKLAGDSSMPPRFLASRSPADRVSYSCDASAFERVFDASSFEAIETRGTTSRLCAHSTLRLRARYATRGRILPICLSLFLSLYLLHLVAAKVASTARVGTSMRN